VKFRGSGVCVCVCVCGQWVCAREEDVRAGLQARARGCATSSVTAEVKYDCMAACGAEAVAGGAPRQHSIARCVGDLVERLLKKKHTQ
jgi:hypothetical protein